MTLVRVLARLPEQAPILWSFPSSWSTFFWLLPLAADLEGAAPTVRVPQEAPLQLLQDMPQCPASTP